MSAPSAPTAAAVAVADSSSSSLSSMLKPQPLILGLQVDALEQDAYRALQEARGHQYDFVTTMIPNSSATSQQPPRMDLTILHSKWWKTSIVGIIPSNNDAMTTTITTDPNAMETSTSTITVAASNITTTTTTTTSSSSLEQTWKSCLEWAVHMNIPAIILPPIEKHPRVFARVLQHVKLVSTQQLWIPISLLGDNNSASASASTLQSWCQLSLLLNQCQGQQQHNNSMHMMLSFPPNAALTQQIDLARALIQLHSCIGMGPIAAIQFQTSQFLINKKGFPTLSKAHQVLLTFVLKRIGRTIRVLLHQDGNSSTGTANIPLEHYQQYLQHFRKTRSEITSVLDTTYAMESELDYLDQLQQPLQPLGDHLENGTYEVFETDPVKYVQYQTAILHYLQDFVVAQQQQQQQQKSMTNTITILVVGAGRGPLVTASCQAYRQLQSEWHTQQIQQGASTTNNNNTLPALQIVAVEKNPSAVLYLQSMSLAASSQPANNNDNNRHPWHGISIQVIAQDLRTLTRDHIQGPKQTADLVVSELLGSFACNELSPECLGGLFANINHATNSVCTAETVSIPMRYTSYLSTVSSSKLYQHVCQQSLYPNDQGTACLGLQQVMETPYVVRPHAASQMHTEVACWSFTHGRQTMNHNPEEQPENNSNHNHDDNHNNDNNRTAQVTFGNGRQNPTCGIASGCGYNAVDTSIASRMEQLEQQASKQQNQHAATMPCWILHGFLGTFTADLYYSPRTRQLTQISTAPNVNFSQGMFSWFPLYFPLAQPVLVPQAACIQATIDRQCCTERKRVWYEWTAQVVVVENDNNMHQETILYVSPIHNPGGRSYHVKL